MADRGIITSDHKIDASNFNLKYIAGSSPIIGNQYHQNIVYVGRDSDLNRYRCYSISFHCLHSY
jgi:hypothetical protein